MLQPFVRHWNGEKILSCICDYVLSWGNSITFSTAFFLNSNTFSALVPRAVAPALPPRKKNPFHSVLLPEGFRDMYTQEEIEFDDITVFLQVLYSIIWHIVFPSGSDRQCLGLLWAFWGGVSWNSHHLPMGWWVHQPVKPIPPWMASNGWSHGNFEINFLSLCYTTYFYGKDIDENWHNSAINFLKYRKQRGKCYIQPKQKNANQGRINRKGEQKEY